MFTRITHNSRVVASFLALAFAAAMLFAPDVLRSQVEEPCEFSDDTDEWACVELKHNYEGQCEGIDCYTSMEICCLDPIIVEPN